MQIIYLLLGAGSIIAAFYFLGIIEGITFKTDAEK